MLGRIFGSPQIWNSIPRFQLFRARGVFYGKHRKNGPREFTFTKKLTANAPEKMNIISQPVFYCFSGALMLVLGSAILEHIGLIMNAYMQKDIQTTSCKTSAFLSLPLFLHPGFWRLPHPKMLYYASFDQVQFFAASTICRIACAAQARKLGNQKTYTLED